MKLSLPPSPYLDTNSSTADLAASAKKVRVPAAGSKTVTVSLANPSFLLKYSFKIIAMNERCMKLPARECNRHLSFLLFADHIQTERFHKNG